MNSAVQSIFEATALGTEGSTRYDITPEVQGVEIGTSVANPAPRWPPRDV